MAKNIVHIYGASGSGTTTLGAYISQKLGFCHMDTDDYYWLPTNPPYTTKRPIDERLKLIFNDFACHENVVLSGSTGKWGSPLITHITLAVRVVTPTEIRIARVKERELATFGSRILPGGDMYEAHLEFLEWLQKYDTAGAEMRSKAQHDAFERALLCPKITVDGSDSLQSNLLKIQSLLKNNLLE